MVIQGVYILYVTAKTHIPIWNVFIKMQSNIAIWQYIAIHSNTIFNTALTRIVSPLIYRRYNKTVKWQIVTVACVQCNINVFGILSLLAIFCYQISLSTICSSIHFQVWFYLAALFYNEGVFAWDIITFVRFMHCYRSKTFDSHMAIPVEVDQKIHQSVHFLPLTV